MENEQQAQELQKEQQELIMDLDIDLEEIAQLELGQDNKEKETEQQTLENEKQELILAGFGGKRTTRN
jgi:hypothetical protein